MLAPPISLPPELALARLSASIPEARSLPGGCRYEPKWDGFRAVLATRGSATIWSRQGTDMTAAFPELAAAARGLPDDTILDGEIVAWVDGRLDFDALQQRLSSGTARRIELAREHGASLVLFDVLACDGRDLRGETYDDRRAILEGLALLGEPPLALSPMTRDRDEAAEWFEDMVAAGVEGLVVKGAAQPYRPGHRDWVKVKHRTTVDVVVGAVIGPLARPDSIVVGLPGENGLRMVGRSTPLKTSAARSLGRLLRTPCHPHPWPEVVAPGAGSGFSAGREPLKLTLVEPVVAEISADSAFSHGAFRHGVRFLRLRPDVDPHHVPPMTSDDFRVGRSRPRT